MAAVRGPVGPEGRKAGEFEERQYPCSTLCAWSVSRGHDKYFPAEWTTTLNPRVSLPPSLWLSVGTTNTSKEEEKERVIRDRKSRTIGRTSIARPATRWRGAINSLPPFATLSSLILPSFPVFARF